MKKIDKETIKYFYLKDELAFKKVYINTYRLLFHLAFSITNNKEISEKVVFNTYINALDNISFSKDTKNFILNLCSICKNLASNYINKNLENNINIEFKTDSSNDDLTLLINIKKILSKEQFDIYLYRKYFNLSFKEISKILDIEQSSCKESYFKAKYILKTNKVFNNKKILKAYENINKFKNFYEILIDFDFNKLPKSKDYKHANKVRKIKLGVLYTFISAASVTFIVIGLPLSVFFLAAITYKDNLSVDKRAFSFKEINVGETNTFKKLNNIIYPKKDNNLEISPEFQKATNDFLKEIYLLEENKETLNFSPFSLYMNLDMFSILANNDFQDEFDSLLGLSLNERKKDLINTFLNNYYTFKNQGTYLYNALFIDNILTLKQDKLDELTSRYIEAFNLDFKNNKDVFLMINWINEHQEGEDITLNDLKLDEFSSLIGASSFYFNWHWLYEFLKENTYFDTFYDKNGKEHEQEYIKSIYFSDVYDYENYLSFYDYYSGGYSIQFLTPKNHKDSIFDLVNTVNFLYEDENKNEYVPIELSIPKFSKKYKNDFTNTLKKSSIKSAYFDINDDSLIEPFKDSFITNNLNPIKLTSTTQQNSITFNEDGTTISSLTLSLGGVSAAPRPDDGYIIKLDSPFIYIIRDSNNIPLYFGTYSV